jgi:ribose 5-phosphate isomerase B
MNIAIGADEAAFELKEKIITHLSNMGHEVKDYGVYDANPILYPDIALRVATAVVSGKYERGIILCGTGIGMAITANKVPGIRAAVCHDPYSAERSRKSNNCQIMTMGSRVVGEELAKMIVNIWLNSEFQGGGSTSKVARMEEIDQQFRIEGKLRD